VQTFLPYADFSASARSLDSKRLLKQRVECLQIMKALTGQYKPSVGWVWHPATLMWRGAERWLLDYQRAVCAEAVRRGTEDTCLAKTREIHARYVTKTGDEGLAIPLWAGVPGFHEAMRGNLLRKDPDHYGPLFPNADAEAEYVWPARSKGKLLSYHPHVARRMNITQ
jgi:hypothetical protein